MKLVVIVVLSCAIAINAYPFTHSELGKVGHQVGSELGGGVGNGIGTGVKVGLQTLEKLGTGIIKTGVAVFNLGSGLLTGLGHGIISGLGTGLSKLKKGSQ